MSNLAAKFTASKKPVEKEVSYIHVLESIWSTRTITQLHFDDQFAQNNTLGLKQYIQNSIKSFLIRTLESDYGNRIYEPRQPVQYLAFLAEAGQPWRMYLQAPIEQLELEEPYVINRLRSAFFDTIPDRWDLIEAGELAELKRHFEADKRIAKTVMGTNAGDVCKCIDKAIMFYVEDKWLI